MQEFFDFCFAVKCAFIVLVSVHLYVFRAEVRRSFITTTVRDESQVTPQGRHR